MEIKELLREEKDNKQEKKGFDKQKLEYYKYVN